MNYNCKPSLMHIGFVNATAVMWNKQDIRYLIRKFIKSYSWSRCTCYMIPETNARWQTIENRVREKVRQVSIPESLKEKILQYYVQPIGVQILKWLKYHCRIYDFDLDIPNNFCWTPQGYIDKKRTAEMITKDETIKILTRFNLAVIYCLEYDITKLWNELSESDKMSFHDKQDPNKLVLPELLLLWERCSKGKFASVRMIKERLNPKCSYQNVFDYAAKCGNKPATEYFLKNLTSREEALVKTTTYVIRNLINCCTITRPPKEYCIEVLCFLLSQMNKEQQINLLKINPLLILETLANCWPWKNIFLETASNLSNFLDQLDYELLLCVIVEKGKVCKDYNYKKLFREFWNTLPNVVQKDFMSGGYVSVIILNLLIQKDTENIKLIFQEGNMDQKDFIFSIDGKSLCKDIISENNWGSLTLFIELFLTTPDDIIRLKEQWHKELHHFLLQKKDRSRLFFKTFEDICSAYNKRKGEDLCSPAKRRFI